MLGSFLWRTRRTSAALGLLAGVLCALAAGCGGGAGPERADGASQPVLAGMPDPGGLPRDASTISTPLLCLGGEFRDDLPHQNVAVDATSALFSPVSDGGGASRVGNAAFAIYYFDLSSLDSPAIPLRVDLQAGGIAGGTSRVFCGLADYARNAWEWGELTPNPEVQNSWSWGETQSGSFGGPRGGGAGRIRPLLPVIIVVFGDNPLAVLSVGIAPDEPPLAAGPVAFSKGWDGTIKGVKGKRFDGSLRVTGDGNGTIISTFYDTSNGQLNIARLQNRVCTFSTVACDADAGLFNDLLRAPDGALLLPYIEQTTDLLGNLHSSGFIVTNSGADPTRSWSAPVAFDPGLDDAGLPIDAGANCRITIDEGGTVHVFYEDMTNARIRHAWRPAGALEWLHDYVSPQGQVAGRPFGVALPGGGVVCVFMADGKLYAADQGAMGWTPHLLADDVFNPLDDTSPIGFCDGSVRPADEMLLIAYSAKGGSGLGAGKVVFQDLHFKSAPTSIVFDSTPGTGAFIDMNMMGDGSVRIAQYNPREYKIYFETGDIPTQAFTSLPAVQYGGPDEDCDGLAFWVDPAAASDGSHDAILIALNKVMSLSGGEGKKEFKGHVTLLK